MAFKKGESGNPKGRTAGQTAGAKLRAAIELQSDAILQTVIDAAINGDLQACKMLLDRITPALKPTAMPITLPVSDSLLVGQGHEIIKGTMTGMIAPDIGAMLITALSNQGKLVEMNELTERLEALEHAVEKSHH